MGEANVIDGERQDAQRGLMRNAILSLLILPWAASCVKVDGGAVEVSWVLQTFDGRSISDCTCSDPEVSRVRLVVARVDEMGAVGADACAGVASCEFPCRRGTGATQFDIPPGVYAISLAPIGGNGQPLIGGAAATSGVAVPAPILRTVVFGQPTELDAFSIQSSCAAVCGGAGNVCTRD
jgi:hypothetical protein